MPRQHRMIGRIGRAGSNLNWYYRTPEYRESTMKEGLYFMARLVRAAVEYEHAVNAITLLMRLGLPTTEEEGRRVKYALEEYDFLLRVRQRQQHLPLRRVSHEPSHGTRK
jgi:hypothetical protein